MTVDVRMWRRGDVLTSMFWSFVKETKKFLIVRSDVVGRPGGLVVKTHTMYATSLAGTADGCHPPLLIRLIPCHLTSVQLQNKGTDVQNMILKCK